MLPTALYDRIGGFDEAFDQAGGGFANLDLWRRASDAASGPLVSLLGEASFHQFHGGTTTNVDDAEKDSRVRAYANAYRALRGEDFASVHRSRLSFRGHMPSEFATGMRQRTLLPMHLGITEQVRSGQLALHFDDGAQAHLQSVYAECALQREVSWLGQPVGVAPADLVSLQEIIHQDSSRRGHRRRCGSRAGCLHRQHAEHARRMHRVAHPACEPAFGHVGMASARHRAAGLASRSSMSSPQHATGSAAPKPYWCCKPRRVPRPFRCRRCRITARSSHTVPT
jgi:hypothetical protein